MVNKMKMTEIISDAVEYPFYNIKTFAVYSIIGIIGGIFGGTDFIEIVFSGGLNDPTLIAQEFGYLGAVILFIAYLLISGYNLDIIKYGIAKRSDTPGIYLARQIPNALKLIVVQIVYYIIPTVIILVLGFIFKNWFGSIIGFIIAIIFAFAEFMAKCRLAKSNSLNSALAVNNAINDIAKIGMIKVVIMVLAIAIISFALAFLLGFVYKYNSVIGGILFGILNVYIVFAYNRATGLLYSKVDEF